MQVRTAVKKLKSTGEITSSSSSRNTVFTVNNYDFYQGSNKQNNSQTTDRQQADNRQITTTKERKEGKKDRNILSGSPDRSETVNKIVRYLNEKAGKHFKPGTENTKKHIKARLNEGYRLDDFIAVIDKKVLAWKGDGQMDRYLRPETLFGKKFEGYLNENISLGNKQGMKSPGKMDCERDYDFDALEEQLLKKQMGE